MNKHTPTPWHCAENFGNEFVCNKDGPIANCGDLVADAEYIVRCVNSHEALAKALQQARKWIREQMADNGCPEDRLDNPPAGSHLANIEAALAAAGVEP